MYKKLKKITLISASMLIMSAAHAYKIIIYTDEVVPNSARKVSEVLKTTYPFSKLNIEIEIIVLTPQELDCGSANGIDRSLVCKNVYNLEKRTLSAGGDQSMIVKDLPRDGGSAELGQGIPAMTTQASPRTMLHEYLHTLGLTDEYAYLEGEAHLFCTNPIGGPGAVFIDPLDPYKSDEMARMKHKSQIGWYGEIAAETPITNSGGTRLGTGDVNYSQGTKPNSSEVAQQSERIGLYKGRVCSNAKPVRMSWHPGGSANIMSKVSLGLGEYYEKTVEKIMIAKGAKLKSGANQESEPKKSNTINTQVDSQKNNSSSNKLEESKDGNKSEIVRPCRILPK